jgi:predicted  nucleic acid-binding Zn-ribbon protein
MKSASDAEQIAEIQKELQEKDTTLEEELTKKIQEEKQKVKEEEIKEVKAEKKISEMKPKVGRTIKFGIETIRIPKEGVYEINIEALMKKRPLIILEKEKIYLIHLPSVFEKVKGK